MEKQFFREQLLSELSQRKLRNPRYSLRAMSKACEIGPSALSEILSGKRGLGKVRAGMIAERLSFTPEIKQKFIASAGRTAPRGNHERFLEKNQVPTWNQLNQDAEIIFSSWRAMALLSLLEIALPKKTPEVLARKLGVSPIDIQLLLQSLEKLGLVKDFVRKKWNLKVGGLASSKWLKVYHHSVLDLAKDQLDLVDREQRDYTTLTLTLDPNDVPKARELIRKFHKQMEKLSCKDAQSEVYNLNVQLFPLTVLAKGCI